MAAPLREQPRVTTREEWERAAFWRGVVAAQLSSAAESLEAALRVCPLSVERVKVARALREVRVARAKCQNGQATALARARSLGA